jgi:hypothetical protein
MRTPSLICCAAALLIVAGTAFAQQPSPSPAAPAESPPAAAPPTASPETAPPADDAARPRRRRGAAPAPDPGAPAAGRTVNKRLECRQQARQQGLRGRAAADQALICMAEARLACTKQAVAQKLDRRARATFIRDCMGTPARGGRGRKRAR